MNQSRTPAGVPTGGQFASHDRGEADIALLGVEERCSAGEIRAGDSLNLEAHTDSGPVRFAMMRSRAMRKAWSAAGRPREVAVVAVRRADGDEGVDDNTYTLDFGGEQFEVDIHRGREVTVRRPFA